MVAMCVLVLIGGLGLRRLPGRFRGQPDDPRPAGSVDRVENLRTQRYAIDLDKTARPRRPRMPRPQQLRQPIPLLQLKPGRRSSKCSAAASSA